MARFEKKNELVNSFIVWRNGNVVCSFMSGNNIVNVTVRTRGEMLISTAKSSSTLPTEYGAWDNVSCCQVKLILRTLVSRASNV